MRLSRRAGVGLTALFATLGLCGLVAAADPQPVPVSFVIDAGALNGPVTLQVNVYPVERDETGQAHPLPPLFDRLNLSPSRTSGKVKLDLAMDRQYQVTVDVLTSSGDPDPDFVYAPAADMGYREVNPEGASEPIVLGLRRTPRAENRAVFFDLSYFQGGYEMAMYPGPAEFGAH